MNDRKNQITAKTIRLLAVLLLVAGITLMSAVQTGISVSRATLEPPPLDDVFSLGPTVEPTVGPANANCRTLGYATSVKIANYRAGTTSFTLRGRTEYFCLWNLVGKFFFDWRSSVPPAAVIVKSEGSSNIYVYEPDHLTYSNTHMSGPIKQGLETYEINTVEVCYGDLEPALLPDTGDGTTPRYPGIPCVPDFWMVEPDRSNTSINCAGCGDAKLRVWVGGTEQPVLNMAVDAFGNNGTLLTLWNCEPWEVRVQVELPEDVDPDKWQLILWNGTGPDDYTVTDEATFWAGAGSSQTIRFQLVSK
ncbi:MAG: hypothetical protein GXY52_10855 [Chloroflexi bacterium]|nr:hypothetical protein [Chloroflexota bacterium]